MVRDDAEAPEDWRYGDSQIEKSLWPLTPPDIPRSCGTRRALCARRTPDELIVNE